MLKYPVARPLTYIKEDMKRKFNKTVFIFHPVVRGCRHDFTPSLRDSVDQKYILRNETGS